MKPTEDMELNRAINRLFVVDAERRCPVGTTHLRDFAAARLLDFGLLDPQDLIAPINCAFTGIAEWDILAEHYATCEHCNA